jgi:hypothetical protein
MRRTAIAAAAAVAVAVTAGCLIACTPEVVRVAGAHSGPVETPSSAAPPAVCGPDDSAKADRFMLTRDDIWEDAASVGQGYANYTLDPAACAGILAATPNPEPVACDLNFPYYPDSEELTELARIHVVGVHTAQDVKVGNDGVVVSAMHETVLDLSANAGAAVLRLARKCGAKPLAGVYGSTSGGVIDMLLDIDETHAVAVTFDNHSGLTNVQKRDLLAKAVSLLDG